MHFCIASCENSILLALAVEVMFMFWRFTRRRSSSDVVAVSQRSNFEGSVLGSDNDILGGDVAYLSQSDDISLIVHSSISFVFSSKSR